MSDKAVLQFLAPVPFAVVLLGRAFPLLLFLKLAKSLVHGGPVYRWDAGPGDPTFLLPSAELCQKILRTRKFLGSETILASEYRCHRLVFLTKTADGLYQR